RRQGGQPGPGARRRRAAPARAAADQGLTEDIMHVLIIGGGIGGLCLAQGLRRRGVSVAVYERDRTPDARLQGYRLSIEPPGSAALHDCLPPELWQILVATSGDQGERMWAFVAHRRSYPSGTDGLRGKALREVVEQRMARWHPVLRRL